MNIRGYLKIEAFVQHYPTAKSSLIRWRKLVNSSIYLNFNELKLTFPSASSVKDNKGNSLVVFNINGNHVRLITSIDYDTGEVLIRYVLTHSEYDKNNWKG
jgi:mRNA interferase HigB